MLIFWRMDDTKFAVLEAAAYRVFTTEEKNRLWKLVMKKATVYRSPDDQISLHTYPNLPQ